MEFILNNNYMKKFIVKIQVSLFSSEPVQEVLIYNKDQSVRETFVLTDNIKNIMKDEPKLFFYAHIDKNKKLNIDKSAKWQDW